MDFVQAYLIGAVLVYIVVFFVALIRRGSKYTPLGLLYPSAVCGLLWPIPTVVCMLALVVGVIAGMFTFLSDITS